MPNDGQQKIDKTRSALVDLLLSKVKDDQFPSSTTMDMIEEVLTPDELPAYAALLMEKVSQETYPSVSMLQRLVALAQARGRRCAGGGRGAGHSGRRAWFGPADH